MGIKNVLSAATLSSVSFRALRNALLQSAGVVMLVVLWQIWVSANAFNTIVLPGPSSVFRQLASDPSFFLLNATYTMGLSLAGLVVGALCGSLIAVAAWSSRLLSGILAPLSLIFSSVPIVAIIPILLRLFGYQLHTAVIVVALITFFSMYVFTLAGLRAVPAGSVDVFRVLGASRWNFFRHLAMPAAVPHWLTGLRIAAPQAVLAAMIAEFLMAMEGLGKVLDVSSSDLQMDKALAASLVATALSVGLYFVADRWAATIIARR